MTAKYFAILTNQGAARLANATALGTRLNLTQLAVGDANGVLPMPNPAQTALIHEQRRAPLNLIDVDPANPGQIIVEQIIPEDEGGFWIREIGLYDDEGFLVAVANCPETYKPKLQEGSGRTQTIRMVLIVSSTEAVTLKIDPAVVLATRKQVEEKAIEIKQYAENELKKHLNAINPHNQYLQTKNYFKEISLLGSTAISEAHKNLGLNNTKYGAPLIGQLIAWPLAKMPNEIWLDMGMEFIPYMGQSFDGARFPHLAQLHPSLKLPADMRGYVPRGWDNSRGVDPGRFIMTAQEDAIRNITGNIGASAYQVTGAGSGAFISGPGRVSNDADKYNATTISGFSFDASRVVPTAAENRMRNVAWNMIVRAK